MKKIFALICLFGIISSNFCFAVEELNKTLIESQIYIKKDPGLIKLPNTTKIDEKAFKAKMVKDENEYNKKIKGLSSDLYFSFDDNGKIKHTASFSNRDLTEDEIEYKNTRDSHLLGYYMFYKTADKLLRANNLDTQNWRFEIKNNSDEINAYANTANHVVIYTSIIDSFYDNEDALSWLIGHELSHHILNHLQQSKKAYDRIQKLDTGIQNSIAFFWLGFPIPFIGIYRYRQHVWFKRLRNSELEADSEALILMARAGYNVDYSNDVMSTLVQVGEHEKHFEDTHPRHKDRIANINKQISMLDLDTLKLEGEKNLFEKPVMTLKRSSDKKSIVLIPEKSRGAIHYSPINEQQKVIFKAYSAYLNDDISQARKLFEQAYSIDKKNYIPCLYLSYINEYDYNKTKNEEFLKQTKLWANRAYKKHSADKNTIKQKMDVESLYKSKSQEH